MNAGQRIWLKLKSIASRPIWLLAFFILPLLLTLPAGPAQKNNDKNLVVVGITDLASSRDSQMLLKMIQDNHPNWPVVEEKIGRMQVADDTLAALLVIPPNFGIKKQVPLQLELGEHRESIPIIWEEISLDLVNLGFQNSLINKLLPQAKKAQLSEKDLLPLWKTALEKRIAENGAIQIKTVGLAPENESAILYLPPYNLEILFLSFFPLALYFPLYSRSYQEQIRRFPLRYVQDRLSSYLAFLIFAFLQLAFLHLGLYLIDHNLSIDGRSWAILLIFTGWQLSLLELSRLLPEYSRLTTDLLLTFFSAILGGCFFWLPSRLLQFTSYISPHAWAISQFNQQDVLALPLSLALPWGVWGIALYLNYHWEKY